MKNNSQTIEKTSEKQVVRPLNVLVKLIKEDLVQRKKIRDNASTWIETEIGEKLIEAKSQLGHVPAAPALPEMHQRGRIRTCQSNISESLAEPAILPESARRCALQRAAW